MEPLIFLDIDGVLNNYPGLVKLRARQVGAHDIDDSEDMFPEHVERLNRIIQETGALVVLSSSWRRMFPLVTIVSFLERRGFRGRIIGKTPTSLSGYRGEEINRWLAENTSGGVPPRFVILDDGSDMEPHQDRLVQTDMDLGLTEEDAARAISLLKE